MPSIVSAFTDALDAAAAAAIVLFETKKMGRSPRPNPHGGLACTYRFKARIINQKG